MKRALNPKHLQYFWMVARSGGIARAAEKLHLTPQTVSAQIKQLEARLAVPLFRQVGKRLELTEPGRVAFSYAEEIFALSGELLEALSHLPEGGRAVFKVGIADAMPKSLVHRLLAPLLALTEPPRLICREGPIDDLMGDLAVHRLDAVLAHRDLAHSLHVRAYSHLLGECAVGLFAHRQWPGHVRAFPASVHGQPLLLPGSGSALRDAMLAWLERERLAPVVVGEFDDSALLKTFARGGAGLFPAPLVIADELMANHEARLLGEVEGLSERFFLLATERRLSNPFLRVVVDAAAQLFRPAGRAGGASKKSNRRKK